MTFHPSTVEAHAPPFVRTPMVFSGLANNRPMGMVIGAPRAMRPSDAQKWIKANKKALKIDTP